jgi:hypothetical protein
VLTDVVVLLTFGCIPLLYTCDALALPALAALVFTGSCAEALGPTARGGLLPDLAREAGWSLERATAAASAIGRAAIVIGPLLAGVLISLVIPAAVLLFYSSCITWEARSRNTMCPHARNSSQRKLQT